MKRFLLVVLGGLLSTAVFAQFNTPTQTGRATQELPDPGLTAAHFSIPLGSTVRIANADTGEEIEVTIVSRIPRSATRVIDLSFDAWDALGLTDDTEVVVNPDGEVTRVPAAPAPASTPAPAPTSAPTPAPTPAPVSAAAVPAPVPEPVFDEDAEDEEPELAIQAAPVPQDKDDTAAPVWAPSRIKVVPGLPCPNSGKTHRLQVGAYAVRENADIAERKLKTAGFQIQREARGNLTRVLAVCIPAVEVKSAVQRLEQAGFDEVWIRE